MVLSYGFVIYSRSQPRRTISIQKAPIAGLLNVCFWVDLQGSGSPVQFARNWPQAISGACPYYRQVPDRNVSSK